MQTGANKNTQHVMQIGANKNTHVCGTKVMFTLP